jgi:hypothetical protein
MWKRTRRVRGRLAMLASGSLACLALTLGTARSVKAQEIEPNEFVSAPAGTNLLLGYYQYGHDTAYSIKNGPTFKNSGVEVNIGVLRYVHFLNIGSHPAGFQIIQPFGSESGANVGGNRVGSAFGAVNTTLSAFYWWIADTANKTYLNTTLFLYPPDGSYDKTSPINLGDNRWSGAVQVGFTKGIGPHFSFDSAVDVTIYGDNNQAYPGFLRESENPVVRGQLWLNWAFSRAFTTSLGWEGLFGGRQSLDGTFTGAEAEEQRIRAAASLFLSPTFQTVLELNHDVERTGGFKQDFGATIRLLKVF